MICQIVTLRGFEKSPFVHTVWAIVIVMRALMLIMGSEIACFPLFLCFIYLFNLFYWIKCTLTHCNNCWFSPSLYVGHVYMRVLQWKRKMCVFAFGLCSKVWRRMLAVVNSNRKRQSSHWSQSAQSPTEPSYSPLQQEMFHYCTLSIGTTAVVCMDVCVCVCVCVGMFMWFMRTQICIMTWVWHRYYKEKVIYEDIFSVPIIKTLINHTEWVFWGESRNAPSPVRAKFRCRVGVGQ